MKNNKKNIVIFASGSGSNAVKIYEYFNVANKVNIASLYCNNPKAKVLDKFKKFNIKTVLFKKEDLENKTILNKKLKKSTELSNVGDREYFYKQLDEMLTQSGFFYSAEMAPVVKRNIRSLFNRASLTHQDLRTLHGIIRSLSGKSNRT